MPYEPQSPRAQKISGSPTELNVSWEAPLEPNGIITSYKVYCIEANKDISKSNNNTTDSATLMELSAINTTEVVPGTATETVVTGLTPYTYYDCYVTANTSVGEGNVSGSATARTDEYGM